ncbi:MAG: glycosyltransferase [Thermoplasmata archaeon]|nr:glycosyltransferase [Thermoplasmata archaeon]
MRVGFYTDTYLPQVNGVVRAVNDIGGELVRRGHEVHVFGPCEGLREHRGMTVHCYRSFPFPSYPGYRIAIPRKAPVKLDVVHAHTPFVEGYIAKYVAKRQEIPLVGTYHTLLPVYTRYLFPIRRLQGRIGNKISCERILRGERITVPSYRIAVSFTRWHYRNYTAVVVPSRIIARMFKIWTGRDAHVVPTGTDLGRFHPVDKDEARKKLKIGDWSRVYLYLGRISVEKRIDVLLKASEHFLRRDELLAIVGGGPWVEDLMRMLNRINPRGRVKYFGHAPEEALPLWYSSADAFITASDSETQGLVLTEAMACGTPIVAADALAIPEVVKNGVNGYLFRPGDPEDLARAVLEGEFPEGMRRECLKTAEEFSLKRCGERLENLYRTLLKA